MKEIKSLIILITLSSFFSSCKTQQQIRREQQISTMSVQMSQSQKLSADVTVRLQTIEEKIQSFQGTIEESAHSKDLRVNTLQDKVKSLEELLGIQSEQLKQSNEQYILIEKRLSTQDAFIQEILKNLKSSAKKRKKTKKKKSLYQTAMADYSKGSYKKSRKGLEKLVKQKKIKGSKRIRVIHNLGMISFIQKRDNDSLTYFSKLFTEFPKSKYNANGLIKLAETFKRIGQKDQAIETLKEMLKRFPKHKRAKIAKKLLKKYN